jgi:CheY-like chemotaxis protein
MRILVVDDEPLVRKSLARLLARSHDVVAVESAEEAIAALAAGFEAEVVFCDLALGDGMDGRTLCNALRSRMRTIIMSGSAPGAKDDVAHAWLMKPMSIAEVEAALTVDIAEAAE